MAPSFSTAPPPLPENDFFVGSWLVQPRLNQIGGPKGATQVEPKVMDLLVCLAQQPGVPVSRDALHATVWPNTVVSDKALTGAVSKLRKAFGDDPGNPEVIETISKGGYRLIAPVSRVPPKDYVGDSAPAPEPAFELSPSSNPASPKTRTVSISWAMLGSVVVLVGGSLAWLLARTPQTSTASPAAVLTSYPAHEISPVLSPDGDEVAFVWNGPAGDNWDLYVKRPGSETPLRLTTDPAHDLRPAWSPDGTRLAFTRYTAEGCALYVVPALTGAERRLGPCLGSIPPDGWVFFRPGLAWSPDGQWLALTYRTTPEEPHSIYLLSLETGARRKLTAPSDPFVRDVDPAFSPDGSLLTFTRWSGSSADLFVMPLEGGDLRRLTYDHHIILGHDWMPDGRHLVFSSERDGTFNLWRLAIDGGPPTWVPATGWNLKAPSLARQGHRMVYENWLYDNNIWRIALSGNSTGAPAEPTSFLASSMRDIHPRYAPDGRRVAFISNRSGSYEVWTADSTGANPVQVTHLDGPVVGYPSWSPDGQYLVFEARPQGRADLYVVDAEGGAIRQLTTDRADDVAGHWSPDGQWIYFGSNRSGTWQIWKMPADGGPPRPITQNGGYAAAAGPDGHFVYYARIDVPGLWRVPVDGGDEVRILDAPARGAWAHWTLSDEGISFYASARPPRLAFFDFASETVRPIATLPEPLAPNRPAMTLSPDGRWLLYTRLDQTESDLMLLDVGS